MGRAKRGNFISGALTGVLASSAVWNWNEGNTLSTAIYATLALLGFLEWWVYGRDIEKESK